MSYPMTQLGHSGKVGSRSCISSDTNIPRPKPSIMSNLLVPKQSTIDCEISQDKKPENDPRLLTGYGLFHSASFFFIYLVSNQRFRD